MVSGGWEVQPTLESKHSLAHWQILHQKDGWLLSGWFHLFRGMPLLEHLLRPGTMLGVDEAVENDD